jgi:hypothetical protein
VRRESGVSGGDLNGDIPLGVLLPLSAGVGGEGNEGGGDGSPRFGGVLETILSAKGGVDDGRGG